MPSGPSNSLSVRLRLPVEGAAEAERHLLTLLAAIPAPDGTAATAFVDLVREPVAIERLEADAAPQGGAALVTLHLALGVMVRHGFIELLSSPDQPMVSVAPMTPHFRFHIAPVGDLDRFRLSRFAFLRRDEFGRMLLESPRSHVRAILHDPRVAGIVAALATSGSVETLGDLLPGPFQDRVAEARAVVSLLAMAGLLDRAGADGSTGEDQDDTMRQWEFHDLLFHSRSRQGRHDYPMGGRYRFKGEIDPQPALRPNPWRDHGIPLPHLAGNGLAANDPPFSTVVEARRSIRHHGLAPITLAQLGEFLSRVARVRGVMDTELGELTNRPYPNGGASYEIELYLTIDRCDGAAPGFYYYDPAAHLLCLVSPPNEETRLLLYDAWVSSAQQTMPQVLITMASRFQRVSWKYSGIAYATQLKNVGALYATMYLVATAMGLAPCGLGLGDSERFCRLAGTSPFAEASIGEFMLGSRAGA